MGSKCRDSRRTNQENAGRVLENKQVLPVLDLPGWYAGKALLHVNCTFSLLRDICFLCYWMGLPLSPESFGCHRCQGAQGIGFFGWVQGRLPQGYLVRGWWGWGVLCRNLSAPSADIPECGLDCSTGPLLVPRYALLLLGFLGEVSSAPPGACLDIIDNLTIGSYGQGNIG
ncbi:hypothetical protein AAY473_012794 [Plecturocebus cupreus]